MKTTLSVKILFTSFLLAIFSFSSYSQDCNQTVASISFGIQKSANPVKPITIGKSANPVKPKPFGILNTDQMLQLDNISDQLKANPSCRISVQGHGNQNKLEQQQSWDRVNVVIRYLVERRGISESRFNFAYGLEGDPLMVDMSFTVEQLPKTLPAPFPNLRSKL